MQTEIEMGWWWEEVFPDLATKFKGEGLEGVEGWRLLNGICELEKDFVVLVDTGVTESFEV